MKFLDRFLRDWRVNKCLPYVNVNDSVLDIGCFDGSLFERLKNKPISKSIGIDPLLTERIETKDYTLIPGIFPKDVPENQSFDSIVMLAVLEHIPTLQQHSLSDDCLKLLNSNGRVIITVPSPFVDKILWVLSKLHLIDGMSLEEHYGFKVNQVSKIFDSNNFRLLKHKKFQLGLNNLFVFEKKY